MACYYLTQYDIEDGYHKLVDVLTKHGHDQKYYLYRTICKNVDFVVSNAKSFKLHIN